MTGTAPDIYQRNCDVVAGAVWDRDFDLALAHIALPQRVVTTEADVTIEDKASLIRALSELRDTFTRMGATAFIRICSDADFQPGDDGTIFGTHLSYVLRGATHLVPPYRSRMILRRAPDGWKAAEIISHVSNRHMTLVSHDIAVSHRTHKD
jgi:hypothetical protein